MTPLKNVQSERIEDSARSADATASRMRTLWLRMTEIYGHRWTSAFGEDAGTGAGSTWGKGLADCAPRQIGAGISAAIVSADPWPPTLPAFRAMCLSIPSFAHVRIELKRSTDLSPFTRLVWSNIDQFRVSHADQDKADRIVREAYDLAREHIMTGGSLPEPAMRIDHEDTHRRETSETEPTRDNPAVAHEHIAKIAALLRTPPATPYTEVDA